MNSNNSITIVRQPIADAALFALIDTVIEGYFADFAKFTAFSVTQELRQQYPLIEIQHDRVRSRVHNQMFNGVFAQRDFAVQTETWNGAAATTFVPYDPNAPRQQTVSQIAAGKQQDNAPTGQITAVTGITISWDDEDLNL